MVARLPHRPGLDRLRGVAVAAVVAYHLGHLRGGFLGVDVFFVLSGFLVTSLLLAEARSEGSKIDLTAFWRARFRRLVPAVMVMVPVVLVAAHLVRWPANRLDDLAIDGFATATWWENWRQVAAGQSYWDPAPSPFRHAWSLAIEEQFYVLWPLVVVGVVALTVRRGIRSGEEARSDEEVRPGDRVRRAIGAGAAVGAALSAAAHLWIAHRVDESDLSRVYLGTDTRVFAILLGCVLACSRWGLADSRHAALEPTEGRDPLRAPSTTMVDGCALVAAGVLVWMAATVEVSDPVLFRRGGFLTASIAALLLTVAASTPGSSPLRSVGANAGPLAGAVGRLLTYLGLRSYGIYLWSWPIQVLAEHRWPGTSTIARSAAVVWTALAAAEISHRVVENPVRRGTGWASTPARRRPAWALGVALPLLVVLSTARSSTPDPVHEDLETDDAVEIALTQPTRPSSTSVTPGEPVAPPGLHVLVIGDSVAFTVGYYKPGLFEGPAGIDWIDSRSLIGCGLLAADGWHYPRESGGFGPAAGGDCEIQAEIEALGVAEEPDVVVIFPGAWEVFEVRSPDGEVVSPMTDRMGEVQSDAIRRRIRAADEVGAVFAVVAWACPGGGTPAERQDPAYIEWLDGVMGSTVATAVEDGMDARYLRPDASVCEGGITGRPTEAKRGWMGDSNHVLGQESGERLWHEWLGPLLVEELTADG